jgi:AcrR family transcriptional regulator
MTKAGDEHFAAPERDDLRTRRSRATSRDRILDAAVHVAIRDGIQAMTLEAVAQEAVVSKGGLIYHFRSKNHLISAMLEHFRAKVQGALEARMAADPNPHGRWLRSLIHMVFSRDQAGSSATPASSEMSRFLTAMLVALVNNPGLLGPISHNMRLVRDRLLVDGPNGMRQLSLWPAIYGLLLWQHLGIISADDPLRQSILTELLTLAEGPDPSVSKE